MQFDVHRHCVLVAVAGVGAGVGLQTIAVIGKLALGRTAMGFGDVKLSVVIGLFLGQWQSLILVLVGAATCGAIVGTVALTWRRGEDRSRIRRHHRSPNRGDYNFPNLASECPAL